MTRYEECLARVEAYVAYLRRSNVNESAIEGLVSSYVEQPGYDVTYRARLVKEALLPIKRAG